MSYYKCTLTDKELVERVDEWVSKLAKSGGKDWRLRVPVDFNRDPDMLITELCERFAALSSPASEGLRWVKCSDKMPDKEGWYHTDIGLIELKLIGAGVFGDIPPLELRWLNRSGGQVHKWLSSSPAPVAEEGKEDLGKFKQILKRFVTDFALTLQPEENIRSKYETYAGVNKRTVAMLAHLASNESSHPTPDKIRDMLGEMYDEAYNDAEISKCNKQSTIESLINKYKV